MYSTKKKTTKKNTTRKRQKAYQKPQTIHWTAFDSGRTVPIERMEYYANELIRGVKERRYLTLDQFLCDHMISYQNQWHEWKEKYPIIANANDIAKAQIYANRVEDAYNKEGNDRLLFDSWRYSGDYRNDLKWQTRIKSEIEKESGPMGGNISVNINCDGEVMSLNEEEDDG